MHHHSRILLATLLLSTSVSLKADLIYYLPFDNGTNASLSNDGAAGGTASAVTGISGATAPTASQVQLAPGIGSTWSEYFPVTGPTETSNRGGAVILPDSTGQFRLNSTISSNQMTLSTWVYWNGNAGGTITSPAGIAGSMNSSTNAGWSLSTLSTGALSFRWVTSANNSRSRATASSILTAGQWTQVTLTFNSSNSAPVDIYVNGVAAATTGSAGDAGMGIMAADANSIALGVSYHTSGQGRQSLNGYLDDFALWDTALSAAKIKSLTTAPSLLAGYDAGTMDSLFTAFDTQGSQAVDGLLWSYATNFAVTSHALGDTWQGTDGQYYLWLGGTSASAQGLLAAVPEPAASGMVLAGGLFLFGRRRRRRRVNHSNPEAV